MGTLGDRLVMTLVILGITLPLAGQVAGAYIGQLPPWYPRTLLPVAFAVFSIALAFAAWKWLDRMD